MISPNITALNDTQNRSLYL